MRVYGLILYGHAVKNYLHCQKNARKPETLWYFVCCVFGVRFWDKIDVYIFQWEKISHMIPFYNKLISSETNFKKIFSPLVFQLFSQSKGENLLIKCGCHHGHGPFFIHANFTSFLKLIDIHTMDDHWWTPTSTPGISVLQICIGMFRLFISEVLVPTDMYMFTFI